ncbi:putative RNA methyltransferase [Paenibacillus polymyxa]|uniref:rRNA (Guanine-N1)-methyltransferase n=1 Tax=Paenibacillus polymyxa (strain SC2) TaxID=886882 RepID=E3E5X8_PAEPS|nr:methyltransferase domain-containing protein [Paenibacillus polymyxa]ADO58197.1 rRNA (guanine-N1)-methyltransferase [Paenibacillus polymyxa SC2]WPQ55878.1 methyltransferase domain-containing protein [Paenibacillus polymyxa]CCI70788.1 rRNA (guanine-N1-)-methyltransferase [Paenibacillus polymyxa M1]
MSKWNKHEMKASLIGKHQHLFSCPVCSQPMRMVEGKSLLCTNQHCYDLSKHGYLHLSARSHKTKYDKQLFNSRRMMCNNGFFDPLNEAISCTMMKLMKPLFDQKSHLYLLDAGCGEGSHSTHIQDKLTGKGITELTSVGMDLSKEGIVAAAKAYPDALWCVADLAHCPFANQQFDSILNILSPSNYAEFKRILSEDGCILKVIPEQYYLQELRCLYEQKKPAYSNDNIVSRFKDQFNLLSAERVTYRFMLNADLVEPLLHMTPLSWRATKADWQRMQAIDLPYVTVDLLILCGKK